MRLKPPQPPPGDNQRLWDQWTRSVNVTFADGEVPTAALDDNSVTNAKLNDMPALSVKARSANSSGDPVDLQATVNGQYLQRNGDLLVMASIALADITADHVTQHAYALRALFPRPQPALALNDAQVVYMARLLRR